MPCPLTHRNRATIIIFCYLKVHQYGEPMGFHVDSGAWTSLLSLDHYNSLQKWGIEVQIWGTTSSLIYARKNHFEVYWETDLVLDLEADSPLPYMICGQPHSRFLSYWDGFPDWVWCGCGPEVGSVSTAGHTFQMVRKGKWLQRESCLT